jgi:hypothetical protein
MDSGSNGLRGTGTAKPGRELIEIGLADKQRSDRDQLFDSRH